MKSLSIAAMSVVLVAIASSLTPTVTQAAPILPSAMTSTAILDAFERTVRSHPRWLMEMSVRDERTFANSPGSAIHVSSHSLCCRDGDRIDVRVTRHQLGHPPFNWRSIVDRWYVAYEMPAPGKTSSLGMFAAHGHKFLGAAMPSGLPAFDGFVADDYVNLVDVVRSSTTALSLRSAPERIDGYPCFVLDAVSADYGTYQIWFDPSVDFYPRKIIVHKSGNSFWSGKRLTQWTNLAPPGSKGAVMTREITYTLDSAQFDQSGGQWFPLQCRVSKVHRYVDGNAQFVTIDCRRTRLDLHPDFDSIKAFQPELRQGAKLSNQEDRQIPYQWSGGAPVPRIDRNAVAAMDQTAEQLRNELKDLGANK